MTAPALSSSATSEPVGEAQETTQPGRLLGERYRLLGAIGSGGMGTVWRGYDVLLNRPVAVKELYPPSRLSDEERTLLRERCLREARAAARISCEAAVTVYDVVEQDDRPWIVMELLEARSLAQVIREDGPLTPLAAARIGRAVLTALEAAHAAGVVHRDVKPANVLLDIEGRIALTDFGVATLDGDSSTTQTGTVLGSPAYMAPERAKGAAPSAAMDLWSLGATLFCATEGTAPFSRPDALTTLHAVLTDPVPQARRAGLLAPVIEGLLAREPGQRLDASAARAMLDDVVRRLNGAHNEGDTRPAAGVVDVTELDTAALAVRYLPVGAEAGDIPRAPMEDIEASVDHERMTATLPRRHRRAVLAVAAAMALPGLLGAAVVYADGPEASTAALAGAGGMQGNAGTVIAGGAPLAQNDRGPARYRPLEGPGYRVSVPEGWTIESEGTRTVVRRPGTRDFLSMEQLPARGGDLRDALAQQEEAVRKLEGYRLLGQGVGTYRGGWEVSDLDFTWQPAEGPGLRARTRLMQVSGKETYRLYFSSAASSWAQSQGVFEAVWGSFRPQPNDPKPGRG